MYITYILERGDFDAVDIKQDLPDSLKEFASDGYIQLLPGINDTDGFFISAVRKVVK